MSDSSLPSSPPILPTRDELAALMAELGPALLAYIRSLARRWDSSRHANLLQDLNLGILEKIDFGQPFVTDSLWQYLCWLARLRVIDAARGRELQHLASWHNIQSSDAPGVGRPPHTPHSEIRRVERKQTLLNEIVQAYCRECERDRRRLVSKETLERSLRGQTTQEVADALGVPLNTVEGRLSRERTRLFEILQQHADAASLFATLFRKKANALGGPLRKQPRQQPSHEDVPTTPEDLPVWLMDAAAAMCPMVERLQHFLKQPAHADVADLDFHVCMASGPALHRRAGSPEEASRSRSPLESHAVPPKGCRARPPRGIPAYRLGEELRQPISDTASHQRHRRRTEHDLHRSALEQRPHPRSPLPSLERNLRQRPGDLVELFPAGRQRFP